MKLTANTIKKSVLVVTAMMISGTAMHASATTTYAETFALNKSAVSTFTSVQQNTSVNKEDDDAKNPGILCFPMPWCLIPRSPDSREDA